MRSEGNSECSDESGQSLKRQAELLRDAALDKSTIGCGLCGNGTPGAKVEIGYFLTESGPDISMADIAHDSVANVGQEGVVYVREGESANSEVDKIETDDARVSSLSLFLLPGKRDTRRGKVIREFRDIVEKDVARCFPGGVVRYDSHKRAKNQVLHRDAGTGSNGGKNGDPLEGVLKSAGIVEDALCCKISPRS